MFARKLQAARNNKLATRKFRLGKVNWDAACAGSNFKNLPTPNSKTPS